MEKISKPIIFFQKEAKEGNKLDGVMAMRLANDANWLSSIATNALLEYNKEPEASEPVFPESALQKMKAGLEKWDKLSKEFDEILNDENIKKLFMPNKEQEDKRSVATGEAQSDEADKQK